MNIFIAKLSSKTTPESLQNHFSKLGEVKNARVIKDRETGESKCFGFVEMENETEGEHAVESLNETSLDGRSIVVKKSEPKAVVG